MKVIKSSSVFFIFFISACYRVNEYQDLNIVFSDNNINSNFLEKYIDSVRNKNLVISDSIKDIFLFGNKLGENERLIYFKNNPEEWYMISFDASPCWIKYVYNKQLSYGVINKREVLGSSQLKKIEIRFTNEILKPAEQYGKKYNLPDSIIYNTKFR